MRLVLDASVALKWFFQSRDNEADCETALAILAGLDADHIQLLQPPHFIAEVAAVLAREKPDGSQDDLLDLLSLEFDIADEPEIYATAIELSMRYRHHLFDTLYHAVALNTPGITLVTADRRNYDQASELGRIALLSDLQLTS